MAKLRQLIEQLLLTKEAIKYRAEVMPLAKKRKDSKLERIVSKEEKKNSAPNMDIFSEFLIKTTPQHEFSFDKERKKEDKRKESYSLAIDYQETEKDENLKLTIKEGTNVYSIDIRKEKAVPEKKPYQLNISYRDSNEKEELKISYQLRDYGSEREHKLQDFTNQLDKKLHIFPKSVMGGVLGFTYLGENYMARRDDLTGDKALMVDVHEAIHTPDEYETRILTDWMLIRELPKYKR